MRRAVFPKELQPLQVIRTMAPYASRSFIVDNPPPYLWRISVCDYSLHNVASRPARLGEELVTTSFPTFTRGFTAKDEPHVAVCLRPGTELAFVDEVDWDRPFRIFRRKPAVGKVARFRQVNVNNPHTHHDAVEFPDGRVVLLTRLLSGQRATVVQLPVELPPLPPEPRATERAPEMISRSTHPA